LPLSHGRVALFLMKSLENKGGIVEK